MRHIRPVGERAALAWEHQVEVDPVLASCQAFDGLAATVSAERVDDDRGGMTRVLRLRVVFVSTSWVP